MTAIRPDAACAVQAQANERMKQLQAENAQLRQTASKRSQALAQSKQFIDTYLQRSSSMVKQPLDAVPQETKMPSSESVSSSQIINE